MPIENTGLFSHQYLARLLSGDPEPAAIALASDLDRLVRSAAAGGDLPAPGILERLGFFATRATGDPRLLLLASPDATERTLGVCLVPGGISLQGGAGRCASWMCWAVQALRDYGCGWGVLADGRRLRLLSQGGSRPYESYLQLDLAIGSSGQAVGAAALVLQNFFECAAWAPDHDGRALLDAHRYDSQAGVSDCERTLAGQAREAFAMLHAGYRAARIAGGELAAGADESARNDAIALACRLTVAFFAEARGLASPGSSMAELVRLITAAGPEPEQRTGRATSWHKAFERAWRSLPARNFGFDAERLSGSTSPPVPLRRSIANRYFGPAFLRLACMDGDAARRTGCVPVDYRDLSVRTLGALHEAMMDAWRDGRRSSGGAFYTPEYVVDYIVRKTVGKGLEAMRAAPVAGVGARRQPFGPLPVQGADERAVPGSEREQPLSLGERLLEYRVCDPAMGTGHFLGNAMHTIANFAVESLARGAGPPGDNPQVPETELFPGTWRARVAERCLYGVDLDPLAVALARSTIWLEAAEPGKQPPCTGNLRCGNSLIGIAPDDLDALQSAAGAAGRRRSGVAANGPGALASRRLRRAADELTAQNLSPRAPIDLNEPVQPRAYFHWPLEFPDVFALPAPRAGFDVVLGNPPYGAALDKQEQHYLNRRFGLGNTDTAALIMARAVGLARPGGDCGFIVPKPFTFASNWAGVRALLLDDLCELVDTGKVWPEVKLEQVLYFQCVGQPTGSYPSLRREGERFVALAEVPKSECRRYGFLVNGITAEEMAIGHKVSSAGACLGDLTTNRRGGPHQSELVSVPPGLRAIGGKQVRRFGLEGQKGFLPPRTDLPVGSRPTAGAILVQNILAHVRQPVDHIRIIATILKEEDANSVATLDTVNQLTNISPLPDEFLLGLLLSRLVNWYVYRFVFARAVRTMHLDGPATSRIPVPLVSEIDPAQRHSVDQVVESVQSLLALRGQLSAEGAGPRLQRSWVESEQALDAAVYRLYALDPHEIALVERQTPAGDWGRG